MTNTKRKVRNWALGIGTAVLIGAGVTAPHLDRDVYIATVTDKERVVKRRGDKVSSKYLVFTELQEGGTKVFKNTDSLLEFKFNSSDLQGRLKEGQTYEIGTYGWRVPLLSMYKNIVSVREENQRDYIIGQ